MFDACIGIRPSTLEYVNTVNVGHLWTSSHASLMNLLTLFWQILLFYDTWQFPAQPMQIIAVVELVRSSIIHEFKVSISSFYAREFHCSPIFLWIREFVATLSLAVHKTPESIDLCFLALSSYGIITTSFFETKFISHEESMSCPRLYVLFIQFWDIA